MVNATCHPEREMVAKGLCRQCYDRARQVPPDVRRELERLFRKESVDRAVMMPAPMWGGMSAWKWVANGHSWTDALGIYQENVSIEMGREPNFKHLSAAERARAYELLGIGPQVGDPEANAILKGK